MSDIKDRAREYIRKHSEYSEVFDQTFIAVDTFTAMVDFATQETKELKAQIEKLKCCFNCKHSRTEYEHCKTDKHEKWEIKEND